jgi:hypothetical protein
MPLGLVGQETPATPDSSPTPAATPQEAALSLNPPATAPSPASDRDFIKLPEASAAVTKDTDVTLTGEVPSNSGESDTITDPNDLMPQDSPSQLPVDAASLAAASEEQEIKVKIRYKETRLKVEKTPALEALLAKAKSARNFESERAAYREYYRELFRRMKKLDPTLTKKCDAMETAYLSRLAQTRIEPTIPLEPPPKPSPLAN